MKKIKICKTGFLISILIFIYTFWADKIWLDSYEHIYYGKSVYLISKILLFVGLTFSIQKLCAFGKEIRQKNPNRVFEIKILLIYLGIMAFFLLLTWPGIWRWDDLWVLDASKVYMLHPLQHYLTSIFYIIALMLFPFPAGVVILQILLISFITTYIISGLNRYFIKNEKLAYLLLIPFLLPPVIDSNLFPLRMSLYAFLEILFLGMIVFEWEKRRNFYESEKSKKIPLVFLCYFIIISVLLAVWRSEAFYYIIAAPSIFIIFFRKYSNLLQKIIVAAAIILISTAGIKIQNNLLLSTWGDQNTIISTLPYINYIANDEDLYQEELESLRVIHKVIDVRLMMEKGWGIVWDKSQGLIKDYQYTRNDFSNYMKTYAGLVFRHPVLFTRVQLPFFLKANGIGSSRGEMFLGISEDLFDSGTYNSFQESFFNASYTTAISEPVRKSTIQFLECTSNENMPWLGNFLPIVYNSIPSMAIMAIFLFESIKKKYLAGVIIAFLSLLKLPLIFATAPASYFMYYYPIYLEGYVVLFTVVLFWIGRRRKNLNQVAEGKL